MFQRIIAKIFNNEGEEVNTISTEEVVLEALCAYRDKLIMSGEMKDLERRSKLSIVQMAIEDVCENLPVK